MLAFLLRAPAHAWNGPDLWPAVALGLATLGCTVASRQGDAGDRGPWALLWCAGWTALGAWNAFLPLLGASLAGLFGASGLWSDGTPEDPHGECFRWPRLGVFLGAALLGKPVWDFGMAREGWWLSAIFLAAAGGAMLPALKPLPGRREGMLLLATALAFFLYFPALPWLWALVAGTFAGALWHRRPPALGVPSFASPVLLGIAVSFALHANLGIPGLAMLLGWRA
jgi:hypothetical protein